MRQITAFPRSSHHNTEFLRRDNLDITRCRWTLWIMLALTTVGALICTSASVAAPAAGDAYVYRVVNGYNRETVGYIRHEYTEASTAQGSVVSVTTDKPALGLSHTEIYTSDGQWLRRPLESHGVPADYEFNPALPAVLPPAGGNSWSVRVHATVPGEFKMRSVRIDGSVLGNERVRVAAGEFDTIKIRRIIYPGDAGDFRNETRIVELDWYAPALGRTVRSETRSDWWQLQGCLRGTCTFYGNWYVHELTEILAAGR